MAAEATDASTVTTTALGPRRTPLLTLLPAEGALAWVRRGEGLVGWGEADRLEVSGPSALAEAAAWWADRCARTRNLRQNVKTPCQWQSWPKNHGTFCPIGE